MQPHPQGSPPPPLVRLAHVGKVYDSGTIALADLTLDVAPGEFISLLGPSGCGKSTALRMIAGLGRHSSGLIDWPTSAYDAAGEPEREIGFVFQEPQLMPWATIAENVRLPLKLA
ncbi:MAG TPA: ATP-binding cassette domain-containing protein, partial [Novosphingobium sp.]|nr:ATP-binding cassette domain-containing protein [Novosphingobium sp.]